MKYYGDSLGWRVKDRNNAIVGATGSWISVLATWMVYYDEEHPEQFKQADW